MKTTKSGFKFEIDKEALNDYELLEDLSAYDNGDHSKFPRACQKILGEKQYKALKEHCRNEKGVIPIDAMAKEFSEMMNLENAKK